MSAAVAPVVARADPQVLTDPQMDAVTAAAGIVHLNLPAISVIVLNIPEINITAPLNLGAIAVEHDIVRAQKVISQVAIATSVGIAVCGLCFGGAPQVAVSADVFNSVFNRYDLP
jgi:hypothetical protein